MTFPRSVKIKLFSFSAPSGCVFAVGCHVLVLFVSVPFVLHFLCHELVSCALCRCCLSNRVCLTWSCFRKNGVKIGRCTNSH